MRLFVILFALTAPLAPVFACPAHENTAQSCMTGFVWDADKGQCIAQITG